MPEVGVSVGTFLLEQLRSSGAKKLELTWSSKALTYDLKVNDLSIIRNILC